MDKWSRNYTINNSSNNNNSILRLIKTKFGQIKIVRQIIRLCIKSRKRTEHSSGRIIQDSSSVKKSHTADPSGINSANN